MNGMRPHTALKTLAVLVSLGLSTMGAMAQNKDLEAYRTTVLAGIDAHMQSIKAVVDGKVPFWHHVADHAVAIAGTSRSLLEIFPDKMAKPDGDAAKREIMPAFQNAAMRFNGESARLVQIVPSGNREAVTAQFKVVSEAYDVLKKESASAPAAKSEAKPSASSKK